MIQPLALCIGVLCRFSSTEKSNMKWPIQSLLSAANCSKVSQSRCAGDDEEGSNK